MEDKKEQIEEKKEPFQVNDFHLDINNNNKKSSPISKYLLIGGTTLFILIFIITLIIVNSTGKTSKNEKMSQIPLGEITCKFDIESIENKISIIGSEYEKNSDFSIVVDGKKLNEYIKEYLFSEIGEHEIKIELYEDLNMNYMFKNIKNLKSVEMYSNSSIKILSMIGTFEKCELLNNFNIKGFDTRNITSLKKLFYNTSLSKLNLDIDTSMVEDVSYMFADTNLKIISLTPYNLLNVVNMSYMFYLSDSLLKVNLEGVDLKNVEDMSHMFQSCKSLNEINLFNINVKALNNMKNMFKDCTSLIFFKIFRN